MATQVQNRRGTTVEHSTFTGANGELTVDTTKRTLVVHDGATAGGRPLLREDQSNLPTSAPTAGIYNASGSLAISTNGTGRVFVTSTGVGVGTTSVNTTLEVLNSSTPIIRVGDGTRHMELRGGSTTQNAAIGTNYSGGFDIIQNGSAAVTIDSSKRVLVGTSSSIGNGIAQFRANTDSSTGEGIILLAKGDGATAGQSLGQIKFVNSSGNQAAWITGEADTGWGGAGSADYPGRLVFSTTADGASSPTERLYLYSNGYVRAPGVYALTTAVAADVRVDSDGYLYRSTSSIRYKKDVETLKDEYADAILNARPVWFRSLSKKDNPDWGYWGFIAEEIEQIDPRLCTYSTNEDGEQQVESVQYDRFVPHLLNLIKRQQQAIETLEAKVAALESA